MIPLKNQEEIKVMREGGKRLREVLTSVLKAVKPGITTLEMDRIAMEKILSLGGKPSFKMVPGYKFSTCLTLNEEVVHGLPGERKIKKGDLLGIDVGLFYQGFHTDLATTIEVGSSKEAKFLKAGKRALEKAIRMVRVGNYVGDISRAIEEEIAKEGFSPVRALTGHGVGRALHEEPSIPCFQAQEREKTPLLKEGMTLAIEVIYNQGRSEVVLEPDGWTISSKDGKISGLFEQVVAVTKVGPKVLTL